MDATPIITPLKKLFASRKFILALTVIITAILVHLVPELKPYADVLQNVILLTFGALFLHLSVEDILTLRASLPATLQQAESDAGQEVKDVIVPAVINNVSSGAAG